MTGRSHFGLNNFNSQLLYMYWQ